MDLKEFLDKSSESSCPDSFCSLVKKCSISWVSPAAKMKDTQDCVCKENKVCAWWGWLSWRPHWLGPLCGLCLPGRGSKIPYMPCTCTEGPLHYESGWLEQIAMKPLMRLKIIKWICLTFSGAISHRNKRAITFKVNEIFIFHHAMSLLRVSGVNTCYWPWIWGSHSYVETTDAWCFSMSNEVLGQRKQIDRPCSTWSLCKETVCDNDLIWQERGKSLISGMLVVSTHTPVSWKLNFRVQVSSNRMMAGAADIWKFGDNVCLCMAVLAKCWGGFGQSY